MIETADHLKTTVFMDPTQVLGGNKRAGVDIGKVNNAQTACFPTPVKHHWVFGFPGKDFHPWRGLKNSISL